MTNLLKFSGLLLAILLVATTSAVPVDDDKTSTTTEDGTSETTTDVTTTTPEDDGNSDDKDALEIPVCKRSDPDLNECIKNVTALLKDKIAEGIPELQLRSIDPMRIPTVKLEQTTQRLDYKAVLMDVELRGLSDYEFTDVNADLDNLTLSAKIIFNQVYLDAEYMLMGVFESLPVEGSGHMMVNFTNNCMVVTMYGGLIQKKGKVHFMSQDTVAEVQVGKSNAKFDNLFTGAGDRTQISEHLINYHADELIEEMRPGIETVVGMLFDDVANKFFKNLPFDKLFPE